MNTVSDSENISLEYMKEQYEYWKDEPTTDAEREIEASFKWRYKEMPKEVEGESEQMQAVRRIWTASLEERSSKGFATRAQQVKDEYPDEWEAMEDNAAYCEHIPASHFPGSFFTRKILKIIHDFHPYEYDKNGRKRPGLFMKCLGLRIDCLITDDEKTQEKIRKVILVATLTLLAASTIFFFGTIILL